MDRFNIPFSSGDLPTFWVSFSMEPWNHFFRYLRVELGRRWFAELCTNPTRSQTRLHIEWLVSAVPLKPPPHPGHIKNLNTLQLAEWRTSGLPKHQTLMHQLRCVKSTELFLWAKRFRHLTWLNTTFNKKTTTLSSHLPTRVFAGITPQKRVFWLFLFHCDIGHLFPQQ